MNPKESNRLRDKIIEILQAHCTDNTGTDVRPLYPLLHWFESELHEYGNHLKGKIIDLEFDIQKLNREILLLETKHEELQENIIELQKDVEARDRTIDRLENDLSEAVEIMKAIYDNVDQYHLDFAFHGGECYDRLKDYLGL